MPKKDSQSSNEEAVRSEHRLLPVLDSLLDCQPSRRSPNLQPITTTSEGVHTILTLHDHALDPTLNTVCRETLSQPYSKARVFNATEPEHYVFPWHGREQKIDPTKAITSWRSAWRSILRTAGIQCRFHDLRHTAVTTMAEKGLPEQTIMAQVGHISPQMMKTYSHIRRQALNQAAAALEPNYSISVQAELVN